MYMFLATPPPPPQLKRMEHVSNILTELFYKYLFLEVINILI